MTDPQQIDIRTLNRDDRMERWHTAALLTHLNQSDARIQATKANITIWHETLVGKHLGDVLDTAHDYLRRYDPKQPDSAALSIATLGHLIRERQQRQERLDHARRPIEAPRRGGPPPHIAKYFADYKERHPDLLEKRR